MQQRHRDVFFAVADANRCWIGVREPNDLADRWIGRPGYIPKPVTCKAKTADNPTHRLAGLVVDPTLEPGAFRAESLLGAQESWRRFAPGGRLPVLFTRVDSGADKGVLKLNGSSIHADYDLMALLLADPAGGRKATSQPEAKVLYDKVAPALNRGFGSPMIQHGPEMAYEGMGARASEQIWWFGPRRQFGAWMSSMSTVLPH